MKQNSTRCQALTKCTDVPGKGTKEVDVTIEIFYLVQTNLNYEALLWFERSSY